MARQSRKIGKRIKKLIFCKTFHRWRFNLPRFDRRIVFPWPERSWICRIFAVGVFGNVDVVGYDVQSRLHDARHDVGRPREEERRFSRRKSRRRQWWSGWVTLPTYLTETVVMELCSCYVPRRSYHGALYLKVRLSLCVYRDLYDISTKLS